MLLIMVLLTLLPGTPVVFLLTDSQIKQESFLEDVDGLLNSGEVPNLFASDERAEVLENLISQMNAAKQSTEGLTPLALFRYVYLAY